MIAGVCGGLAEHLDLDPLLIRLLFVLIALTPGGILLYLVLWVLMPPPGGAPIRAAADVGAGVRRMSAELRQVGESAWTAFSAPGGGASGGGGTPPPPAEQPVDPGSGEAGAGGGPPGTGVPPGTGPAPGGGPFFGPESGTHIHWRARRRGVTGGVILILIGLYLLLSNLGLLDWWQWQVAWPVVLIAVGLLILVQRLR